MLSGEGWANLKAIMGDLLKSGYRGYFSMEPHIAVQVHISSEHPEEVDVRGIYERILPSNDCSGARPFLLHWPRRTFYPCKILCEIELTKVKGHPQHQNRPLISHYE